MHQDATKQVLHMTSLSAAYSHVAVLCRSLKRERDLLQHRVDTQEPASPAPQPKLDGVAQQLQDLQAELVSSQAQVKVRTLPPLSPPQTPPLLNLLLCL